MSVARGVAAVAVCVLKVLMKIVKKKTANKCIYSLVHFEKSNYLECGEHGLS